MAIDDDYTPDNEAINNARIFTIVIASIAILFPLSVVVILIQRYNALVRGKSLIHYVMMIAIADTMTAFTIALGYPGGSLCSIQGFLLAFFSRMSWFFTDVLIFQLFYIVVFQKYFLNVRHMHCIVWPLNIFLQLLPYTTGTTYGADDDKEDFKSVVICNFGKGTGTAEAAIEWTQYTFNIELLISFFIIVILSAIVIFYSLNMNGKKTSHLYLSQRIRESWSVVILYPCAMLIAWVPGSIYGYYFNNLGVTGKELPYHSFVIVDYLNALNALYGPFLALIFYTKTLDARRAWMYNLRCMLYVVTDVNIDERTTCSSIISIEDTEIAISSKDIFETSFGLWKKK